MEKFVYLSFFEKKNPKRKTVRTGFPSQFPIEANIKSPVQILYSLFSFAFTYTCLNKHGKETHLPT